MRIRVQAEAFDVGAETAAISSACGQDTGAIVSFVGLCRGDGGRLQALQIEHYPEMAEGEITRIAEQARDRWKLDAITILHRFGRIAPGEQIVLVLTASAHRRAAFDAASFLMDYLKSRAPFWKKEIPADGRPGNWIEAQRADQAALAKWEA